MAAKKPQLDGEVYYPSKEVISQAVLKDWDKMAEFAREDLAGFWAKEASELDWFKKWEKAIF
jgi:acetyl-CoA synthetase